MKIYLPKILEKLIDKYIVKKVPFVYKGTSKDAGDRNYGSEYSKVLEIITSIRKEKI